MNKKEINEIKKNLAEDKDFFTINHVVTAMVDAEKNIKCKSNRLFTTIEQDDCDLIRINLKKVLSGTIGKNLLEYPFPKDAYLEGGSQPFLYEVLNSRFEDEEITQQFLQTIIEKTEYVSTYSIFAAHCTYSVFNKNKAGDEDIESDTNYNFIITAICPVELRIDGLIYNEETNSISKKESSDRVVGVPTDGFLFPLFNDRAADINGVLYYTKNAKKPNTSIIEDLLGCEFDFSCDSEKESFHAIIENVVGDELNYDVITSVNEKIQTFIDQNSLDTQTPKVDSSKLSSILWEAGVSQEKLENLPKVYEQELGQLPLKAVNLVDKKTVVSADGITVTIGKDYTDKVRTQMINGRKCIVIAIDDPDVTVNGLDTKIE